MHADALCLHEIGHIVLSRYLRPTPFSMAIRRLRWRPVTADTADFLVTYIPTCVQSTYRDFSYQSDLQLLQRINILTAHPLRILSLSWVTLSDHLFFLILVEDLFLYCGCHVSALHASSFPFCFLCFTGATHSACFSNKAIPQRLSGEVYEHPARQLPNRLHIKASNYLCPLRPLR